MTKDEIEQLFRSADANTDKLQPTQERGPQAMQEKLFLANILVNVAGPPPEVMAVLSEATAVLNEHFPHLSAHDRGRLCALMAFVGVRIASRAVDLDGRQPARES